MNETTTGAQLHFTRHWAKVLMAALTLVLVTAVVNSHAGEAEQCDPSQPDARWQQGVIEGALAYNPLLVGGKISVAIEENRALLSGNVSTQLHRALAEQIALSVRGIAEVSNQLVIVGAPTLGNADGASAEDVTSSSVAVDLHRLANVTITNKVKSQLLANRQTSGSNIDIATRDRVVTLTGEVMSEAEKQLAYLLVKNTQGVKWVVNNLKITNEHGNAQAALP